MTVVRAGTILAGLALCGYGIGLAAELPPRELLSAALWAGALLIAHDGVFAPLCLAAGHGVRRVVPAPWWPALLCGTVGAVTVLALAAPVVLPRPDGAGAANPSVLDRPYGAAVLALLSAIAAATAVAIALRARAATRGRSAAPPRRGR